MFGRTKEAPAPTVEAPVKEGGKNRPTPTRAQAQAANRRPLVGTDRRAAAGASRASTREERQRVQAGRLAGEDRYLGARDAGPVRALVRDVVDSRRNLGDWFMIALLVVIVGQWVGTYAGGGAQAAVWVTGLMYLVVLAVVVDSFFLLRQVKRAVTDRFGADAARGLGFYTVMRGIQLRRLRIPRPAVRHGEPPR